jgi:hypothetical protein
VVPLARIAVGALAAAKFEEARALVALGLGHNTRLPERFFFFFLFSFFFFFFFFFSLSPLASIATHLPLAGLVLSLFKVAMRIDSRCSIAWPLRIARFAGAAGGVKGQC